MKHRALIAAKEKIPSVSTNYVSLITLLTEEERSQFQTKYGIELPASTWIVRVEALKIGRKFKNINSLLEKETHDRIFLKKHVQDTC
jgi:hypothetical protein